MEANFPQTVNNIKLSKCSSIVRYIRVNSFPMIDCLYSVMKNLKNANIKNMTQLLMAVLKQKTKLCISNSNFNEIIKFNIS